MLHQKYRGFAALLLILISLASGYYSFFINPAIALMTSDGAAKWEERMEPIRENLPIGVVEVGYIADDDRVALVQEYALTKYALTPVIVRQGDDYEWIIGNFTQPNFENFIEQKIQGEYELFKYGSGIYLVHRLTP